MEQEKADILFRQIVSLGSTLVTLYVLRVMMRPGFARHVQMKSALAVKRVAQNQADTWQTIATNAANNYNKCRL